MYQKKNLIMIIVAIVLLVGLIVLALSLDGRYKDTGSGSTSSESSEESSENKDSLSSVTYEEYNAMSKTEQDIFRESFVPKSDIYTWYAAAKKAYEDSQNNILIGGDGSINLGDILNPKE